MPTVISIVLTGDEKQLEASLRRGEIAIQRMRQETEKNAGQAFQAHQRHAQGVNMVTASLTSLAGALGVTLGAGALLVYIKNLVSLGDRLSDLSDATGISIKTLGGLRPIVESSGTSIEDFATGMRAMMRSLVEANDPTSKQAQALKKLGISTQEMLQFMSDPDGFILAYSRGLAQLPTVADRLTVAQELGSRAGAKQLAVFMEIAEKGLPQLSEETAKAYEALGKLADRFVVLTIKATDFIALGLSRIAQDLGLIANEDFMKNVAISAQRVGELTKRLSELSGIPAEQIKKSGIGELGQILEKQSIATKALASSLLNAREQLAKAFQELPQAPPAPPVPVLGPDPKFIEERAKALEKLRDRLADVTAEFFKSADPQRAALEQINKLTADVSKFNDPTVRNLIESIKLWTLAGIEKNKADKETEENTKRLNELLKEQIKQIDEAEAVALKHGQAILESGTLEKQLEIERLELQGMEREARLLNIDVMDQEMKMRILSLDTEIGLQNRLLEKLDEVTALRKQKLDKELQKAKEVTINVGQEISRAVGDAFQGVILGTSKLADVGKNLFAALLRSSAQFFVDVLNKKLGFEQIIFSNLRGFMPAANSALAAGGVSMGGGGGGGGFLGGFGDLLSGAAGLLIPSLGGGAIGGLIGGSRGAIGGAIGGGLGSLAGNMIVSHMVAQALAAGAGTATGGAIGAMAGSFIPVIGTILGAVGGSFLSKLFGGEDRRATSPQRRAAAAQAGLASAQLGGFTLTQQEADLLGQIMQSGGGGPLESRSVALLVAHLEAGRAKGGRRSHGEPEIMAELARRGLPTGAPAEIFAAFTVQQEQAQRAAEQAVINAELGRQIGEALTRGVNELDPQSAFSDFLSRFADAITNTMTEAMTAAFITQQVMPLVEGPLQRIISTFGDIGAGRTAEQALGLARPDLDLLKTELETLRPIFTAMAELMRGIRDEIRTGLGISSERGPVNITVVSNDPEEFARRLADLLGGRIAPGT